MGLLSDVPVYITSFEKLETLPYLVVFEGIETRRVLQELWAWNWLYGSKEVSCAKAAVCIAVTKTYVYGLDLHLHSNM